MRKLILLALLLCGCAREQPFRYGRNPDGYVTERQRAVLSDGSVVEIETRRPFARTPRNAKGARNAPKRRHC